MTRDPSPQDLVEHGLAASRSDDCMVVVEHTTSANLRWANNTLTTNGVMRGIDVTVISFHGDAVASVGGSAATVEQVRALVERADAAAATAAPASDRAELVRDAVSPDWEAEPESTSVHVYDEFAPALGSAFERAETEKRVLYGFVNHELDTTFLGSTTGLRLRHQQPNGHYGVTGKPADLSASAWVGGATRDFAGVDPLALDAELRQRLARAERRVDLPAGRYDTVLPPTAVADLMIYAYWLAGARQAHDGQSPYGRPGGGTRIGEALVDERVRLFSSPTYSGLECETHVFNTSSGEIQSVFDNGLALEPTDWIRDGRLTALLQTRETATLTGQPVTPPMSNLILEVAGSQGDPTDLVGDVERGLLVTCLWYIRVVDPQTMLLTGLTRDGTYLVEGGEVVGVANNFRFNESPLALLRRFSTASTTVPAFSREWGDDYFSRAAMPALRVPDFNMSSVSQAL